MWRVIVRQDGRATSAVGGNAWKVPTRDEAGILDIEDRTFVIGSDATAKVRLPAAVARPFHIRIDGDTYRTDDASGNIGQGHTFHLGAFTVRVAPAPPGAIAAPPQRTQSLARELMRNLLVGDSSPTLEIERGPSAGTKRALAPPDSTLTIGRGDDAMWVILDRDLSKLHAEIRRGWDGVRVVDLGSKNGTRVDGVGVREAELRDGATLELGNVVLRYRDPAERHLAAELPSVPAAPVASVASVAKAAGKPATSAVFYAAVLVMALAIAGVAWIALS